MSLQSEQLASGNLRKITFALGTALATLGVSAALTYGYLELIAYREVRTRWIELQALAGEKDYNGCINRAETFETDSRYSSAAHTLMQQCRLDWAKQKAEQQGDLVGAIDLAARIPETEVESYEESQELVRSWSEAWVDQGQKLYQAGKLDEAIATLRRLPSQSPLAVGNEALIQSWQADWKASQTAVKTAEDLLGRGQWLAAKQALDKVAAIDFWKQKAKPLLQQADEGIALVEQYEAEQARAALASPQAVYDPPSFGNGSAGGSSGGGAVGSGAVAEPPTYVPPAPVAAAPPAAPAATASFDQSVENLYQSYRAQGQGTWDAWSQACRDAGGQIIDRGPEAICAP